MLEQRTANISQAAGLNRVLTALSDANDALGAGGAQTGELSDVYFAPAGQRSAELSALGGQIALFQRASARLRNDVAPVRNAFLRLDADREWQHYQSALARAADRRHAAVEQQLRADDEPCRSGSPTCPAFSPWPTCFTAESMASIRSIASSRAPS